MKLYIVGAGPGGEGYLTGEARAAIEAADAVIAMPRLAQALGHLNPRTRVCPLSEVPAAVLEERDKGRVAVLVSGDSGFYSLAASLPAKLGSLENLQIERIAGLSSLQYLCARLGLNYEDARCVSLHGRGGSLVPWVSYNRKVFALTGGEKRAQHLIRELCEAGLGAVRVCVGENLGLGACPQSCPDSSKHAECAVPQEVKVENGERGPAPVASQEPKPVGGTCALQERILDDTAQNLAGLEFSDLACLMIINENFREPGRTLPDSEFIRASRAGSVSQAGARAASRTVPMTKQAVRTLAIAALNVQPGDTVLDVGAGTGSVAIELASKACEGLAFAVEREPEALKLLAENREKFGAFNLRVLPGEAPAALAGLPPVDRAFIGGSGGKLGEIMQAVLQTNPKARLAVTAITLETLGEALACFKKHGLEAEVVCINAAHSRKVGGYNMMKAENPVYTISGGGYEG